MTLWINTTDYEKAKIRIQNFEKEFEAGRQLSECLLKEIDGLLKEAGVTFKDISAIKVKTGPGSFTGIRIGIALANALGFALGAPVNQGKMAIPQYGCKPNITLNLES